jgi:hypothetical protein
MVEMLSKQELVLVTIWAWLICCIYSECILSARKRHSVDCLALFVTYIQAANDAPAGRSLSFSRIRLGLPFLFQPFLHFLALVSSFLSQVLRVYLSSVINSIFLI